MFYSEEDVQPAVTQATMIFGQVGRMDPLAEFKNVSIATKQFGKLWYGDVSSRDLDTNIRLLQSAVGQQVYVFLNDNDFNYTTNTPT
jgi:hypothetical protein